MGRYSKFAGVSMLRTGRDGGRPWKASLGFGGHKWTSRGHATERAAALARDMKIVELGLDLPLNILKRA